MIRLLIDASRFQILPIQLGQNYYIVQRDTGLPNRAAMSQHREVVDALLYSPVILSTLAPRTKDAILSDVVFVANGGLSLPRLNHPCILLPNMKYANRQGELPVLKTMFDRLGIQTVMYPGQEPFEGQADLKWFHGGKRAICGYGQRATKKAFDELDAFFEQLYGKESKPELLIVKMISPLYYHLDVAMLEYDDTKCVIHRDSVTPHSLRRIQKFLGKENVTVIDTTDSFCLNAVVDGPRIITHVLTDPKIETILEEVTGREVVQIDTTEFEKSGGSVRCLVMDIHGE